MTIDDMCELMRELDVLILNNCKLMLSMVFSTEIEILLRNKEFGGFWNPTEETFEYALTILRYTGKVRNTIPKWELLRDRLFESITDNLGEDKARSLLKGLL